MKATSFKDQFVAGCLIAVFCAILCAGQMSTSKACDPPCDPATKACVKAFWVFPVCYNLAKKGEFCSGAPSADGTYPGYPPCSPGLNCTTIVCETVATAKPDPQQPIDLPNTTMAPAPLPAPVSGAEAPSPTEPSTAPVTSKPDEIDQVIDESINIVAPETKPEPL